MSDIRKLRIVVVGGGAAGAVAVRNFSKKLDPHKHELTLISARTHFAYLPAGLRLLVSRDAPLDTVFMSYDKVFDRFPGQLRIGRATSVEANPGGRGGKVILDSGDEVLYDVVVIATGSSWEGLVNFPDDETLYREYVEEWRNKFENANNVVIAGGGAVGIETAGEIKDIYPDKPVTIVHAGKHLLSHIYPQHFRMDIEKRLRIRGINLIFNDKVVGQPVLDPGTPLTTEGGKLVNCDLLVIARGAGPNTSLLQSLEPFPLTERGYVKILPSLQLQSHPSIFALGDITDLQEAKQFQKTAGHAAVVVPNVLSYLEGKELKQQCKPGKEIIMISNGRNGGASYLEPLLGITFGDFVTKTIKSKDLFVGLVRKSLGI